MVYLLIAEITAIICAGVISLRSSIACSSLLLVEPSVSPQNYWVNTSSNDIIRNFIEKADAVTREEIEQLIEGGSIKNIIKGHEM